MRTRILTVMVGGAIFVAAWLAVMGPKTAAYHPARQSTGSMCDPPYILAAGHFWEATDNAHGWSSGDGTLLVSYDLFHRMASHGDFIASDGSHHLFILRGKVFGTCAVQ